MPRQKNALATDILQFGSRQVGTCLSCWCWQTHLAILLLLKYKHTQLCMQEMAPHLCAHTDTHTHINTSGKSVCALEIDPICLSLGNKQVIFLVNSAVSAEALLNWKAELTMDYLKTCNCGDTTPVQQESSSSVWQPGSKGSEAPRELCTRVSHRFWLCCVSWNHCKNTIPEAWAAHYAQKVSAVLYWGWGTPQELLQRELRENSYMSIRVVNPGWIAPQCTLFSRCTEGWDYPRGQQLTFVSSPLLSLQKPLHFHKGRNRVEGLQATGKAELGCSFSAMCSIH